MSSLNYSQVRALLTLLTVLCTLLTHIPLHARSPVAKQPAAGNAAKQGSSQPVDINTNAFDTSTFDTNAFGTTAFLSPPVSGDPLTIALDYISKHRFELGLSEADLSEIIVKDRYLSAHNGVTHLYLRQRWRGIEVYNGDININVMPDGRIINLGNGFVSDLSYQVKTSVPSVAAVDAVRSAANSLGLTVSKALQVTANAQRGDGTIEVNGGGFASQPIPLRLVYFPGENHQVRPGENHQVHLAWTMTIAPNGSSDVFDLRIDATTGAVLQTINLTNDTGMHYQPASQPNAVAKGAQEAPLADPAPNSYFVYDLPARDPHDAERTLVTNPADLVASPFGWHDSDGAAGAEYTTTRGNNAFAYADLDIPNGFGVNDVTSEGGSSLVFSSTAVLTQAASTYRDAAVTNLFFVTNKIHDVLYQYGFDEASGNFQINNYGKGGLGNDSILAEAQDYFEFNNANFYTPIDGQQPRMQMFLASDKSIALSVAVSPSNASYIPGAADFGPTNFSVSGSAVLVNDGVGAVTDGCNAITNVTGKIALIDRGLCDFRLKAVNAQNAGALAALIINNRAGDAPPLGDGEPASVPVTIPVLSLSQADGAGIKSQLGGGVTLTLTRQTAPGNDGALDNSVIIHEFGHGVSNRLTGGPANANCLSAVEAGGMGEGWSDFLALVMTAVEQNNSDTPIAVGRWLVNQAASGGGIRHYPYTTDMNVNPLTFAALGKPNPFNGLTGEVHDVGEVWTAALWEVYWNLVADYGFDSDLYLGNSGNNLALQLVLDGMKLQPCNPTFVAARNAILLADQVNNDGANVCRIWEGFAKRGLGYSAFAGSSTSVTDSVEAFDLPPLCMVDVQPTALDVCASTDASFDIAIGSSLLGDVNLSVNNLPANTSASFSVNPLAQPNHSTLTVGNTAAATPATYLLKVVGVGMTATHTTTVSLKISSPITTMPVLLTPANDASEVSDYATFSWQAVGQASNYLFEISAEPTFATLFYSKTVATSSIVIPYALRSQRTYYWRVTARNTCSALASAVFSLTVRTVPRLLVVDDDAETSGYYNLQPTYINALNTLQIPFDVWGTGTNADDEPQALGELTNYSTILWFAGVYGDGPNPATGPILSQFLDQDKCLIVTAHDYYYYYGLTALMTDYLGVENAVDDDGSGMTWQTVVTGSTPIFDSVGSQPLSFLGGNYSDILTPTASAGVAFMGDVGPAAAVYKDGGHYRTIYAGFEFESLPANAFTQTLQSALTWCNFQNDLSIQQAFEAQTTLLPGQPVTYTLVYHNNGVGLAEGIQITATLPGELVETTASSENGTITATAAAAIVWQVPNLAAGAVNTITVTGKVDAQQNTAVTLSLSASIGRNGFDSNPDNNATATIERSVVVPQINLTSAQTAVKEGDGMLSLVVALDQANPYASTQVTVTSRTDSAMVDVDYADVNERLIIPAGQLTATITLAIYDDTLIELDETFFVELSSPQAASLGSLSSTRVTIIANDQAQISFAQSAYTVTEGSGNLIVTAQLDQIDPAKVVSALLTMNPSGTPASHSSSEIISTVITIPAGSISGIVVIPLVNDSIVEIDESFVLQLSNPDNAALGQPITSSLTVLDDDLPQVSFAQAVYTASEKSGSVDTVVQLDQPNPNKAVSVLVSLMQSDLIQSDLIQSEAKTSQSNAFSTVVTIPVGAISSTLTLTIADDLIDEPDEIVMLQLAAPSNATLGQLGSATLTILDDDLPSPNLSVTVESSVVSGTLVSANEIVTFTVTISNSGGPAGAGMITVTVPSNSVYVTNSGIPTPASIESVLLAATSAATATQKLVWRWTSIEQNSELQFKYSLKLIDASSPLSNAITVNGDGLAQPVSLNVSHPAQPPQPTDDTTRRVYLPVVNR